MNPRIVRLTAVAKRDNQMETGGIVLYPNRDHCIETVARQEQRALLTDLLAMEKDVSALANRYELVTLFIRTADFKKIRAEMESLLQTNNCAKVSLKLSAGEISYRVSPGPKDA